MNPVSESYKPNLDFHEDGISHQDMQNLIFRFNSFPLAQQEKNKFTWVSENLKARKFKRWTPDEVHSLTQIYFTFKNKKKCAKEFHKLHPERTRESTLRKLHVLESQNNTDKWTNWSPLL